MQGATQPLQDVVDHVLELGARQPHHQVLRTGRVGRDERQIDFGLEQRRKLDLRFFRRFLQALQRHLILGKIDAVFLLELADDPVDQPLVDVVAAKVGVAVGRLHFHDAVADFEDRDVEGAAAEVKNGDGFVLLLVEPVGKRRRRRLVDDAHYFEAGDLAGIFGRLALRVVEVRRDRDDGRRHFLAQIRFGRFLQFASGSSPRSPAATASCPERRRGRRRCRRGRPYRGPASSLRSTSSKRRPMKRLIE